MLHTIVPIAPILAAIRVSVGALTMLLVVAIVTFIAATVLPDIDAMAMHDTVLERALEVATVGPLEAAIAAHFVLAPHARVLRAIGPEVAAFALLDSLAEHAMVVAAIGPHFHAFSITLFHLTVEFTARLQILQVLQHVIAHGLAEYAQIRQGIVLPEALVCLTAWLWRSEDTHAYGLAIDPIALKIGAIGPDQLSISTSGVFIINYGLISGSAPSWRSTLLMVLALCVHVSLCVDWHHAHLSHVLKRAKVGGLEAQLAILDAQNLILIHCLDLFRQEFELGAWIWANCTR